MGAAGAARRRRGKCDRGVSGMRIGFVNTGTIQQNASTIRCVELGRLLAQDGHEVSLFLPGVPDNRERYGEEHDGIRLHYTAAGSGREQLSKTVALARTPLDWIHCMSSGTGVHVPAWLAAQMQRVQMRRPRVIMDFDEWQSLWLRYPGRAYLHGWERFACRFSDRVIFASPYLAQRLGRHVPAERCFTLPYAVDRERFEEHAVSWERIRARHEGRRLAVYMGNMLPQFDAGRVLDAVAPVLERAPDALFLFIGSGSQRAQLEAVTQERGLGDAVRFLGFLPDREVAQHLRAAHALLFPIADTLLNRCRSPHKLFSYLAAGRPIVTNPLPNVVAVLEGDGTYFDFHSTVDFADRIVDALEGRAPVPEQQRVEQHSWPVRYRDYLAVLA
jgi:glycosyltransferase involved in cell wall biosynthesis